MTGGVKKLSRAVNPKGHLKIDEEFKAKLAEIDEAIETIEDEKRQIEHTIEKKLDAIILKLLTEHRLQDSLETYKNNNSTFIETLRNNLHSQYMDFLNQNKLTLEKTREKLVLLKEF